MTLIAAYRPHGIPVLLGDFLITGGGSETSNKKIYRVSSNFVIGWTGYKILAATVLRQLLDNFQDRVVTVAEIERFLVNYEIEQSSLDQLLLIAWIVENNNPRCFLWNYAYPRELFYQAECFAGSGEEKFKELKTRDSLEGSWNMLKTNVELAIQSTLIKAAELYSDEILDKMNRRQGFGYGYELLYFDGTQFRYLDNIAYLGMDIYFDPTSSETRMMPYEFNYWYNSLGDASFLLGRNLKTGIYYLESITPVFNAQMRNANVEFVVGSLRAKYYCFYFRMQSATGEYYQGSFVLPDVEVGPSRYEKFINETYRLEVGRDFIKNLYWNIKGLQEYREQNAAPWGWGGATVEQRFKRAGGIYKFEPAQNDKCVVGGLMIERQFDYDYRSIDYAIMCCADGTVQCYEKGIAVGPVGIKYNSYDPFNLRIGEVISGAEGARIGFFRGDELLYWSDTPPVLPLKVVCLVKEDGASIANSQLYNL